MEQANAIEFQHTGDELIRGTETILVVEDEEVVRTLTRQILEECGYTILEAGNGIEVLSICEKHNCHIELLMTDVVMPQMGGRELAERFAQIYPQMRILFTSGGAPLVERTRRCACEKVSGKCYAERFAVD